jgi:NAD+ kinase
MTSTAGSKPRSKTIARAAVVTHGKRGAIGPALEQLSRVANEAGVQLLIEPEEAEKHGVETADGDLASADIVVVLGGDGTMLRTMRRFLGAGVPVLGVNFGRVGFLTAVPAGELETGLSRVFAGDYEVIELATLEVEHQGRTQPALNDLVVASGTAGRMVELDWAIGGEALGVQPCDGIICATPSGSTAYNLSNGGPVLVWGIDAMVVTFVAPHSLHARPLVVPRGDDVIVWNRTPDVTARVIVDGHVLAELGAGGRVRARLGPEHSLLATLPEVTFFRRYGHTFTH